MLFLTYLKTLKDNSIVTKTLNNDQQIHDVSVVDTINSLRPRQNGRNFADDIFKCIFLTENVWIPIKISLKFVPKGLMNDIPALV